MAVALLAMHATAHADLWAYVDEQVRSHVANHQVDAHYTLFFKFDTTLDVPASGPHPPAEAAGADSGEDSAREREAADAPGKAGRAAWGGRGGSAPPRDQPDSPERADEPLCAPDCGRAR